MREAVQAGRGRGVKRVVVLADGAAWIWVQARCQCAFPGVEVIEILDFYHASQQVAHAAAAVYGAHSAVGTHWWDTQCPVLRHRGVRPVQAALADLHPQDTAGADTVPRVRAYVATHAARMNYPRVRARLLPLGSGAIERTVKHLMQAREVLAGMRWTRAGAHAVANLRALHRSADRWAACWRSQPLRRARARVLTRALVAPATVPVETTLVAPPEGTIPCVAAVAEDAPTNSSSTTSSRIQIEGKPWAKGKR